MDVGTGIGIIGIYAAVLGASKVVSTDIDPLAITYAGLNAQTVGVDGVMDIRNVPANQPQAFSVIKPGEKFDVIIANLPYVTEIHGPVTPNMRRDNGELIMSLIDGLREHLNKGGHAIIFYRTLFSQSFAVGYAKMKGYAVRFHRIDRIGEPELNLALQTLMTDLQRARGIDPAKMDLYFRLNSEARTSRPPTEPLFGALDADKNYYGGVTIITPP